ncbi:hypothetical protein SAMN05444170_0970 [Bradyrhizobium erythrophlei]|uniref:Uncharacterized protein n=1 Tax=Bradyrhizobium erythrophlei TaxID=1437360 RepID=A0A1M7T713_9BRAD|nr:hypothetical protein SAMN05444170_0970 [Bradyrhizobium erythrophlei]
MNQRHNARKATIRMVKAAMQAMRKVMGSIVLALRIIAQ